MRLVHHELYYCRLGYQRQVKWFNSSEDAGEFLVLRVFGEDDSCGVAEATVKPTWGGLSVRALAALVEDVLIPELTAVDVRDMAAVADAINKFPGNQLAKSLVVNACRTLAAASARRPLWRLMGGSQDVDVSWCVTRQAPDLMAGEAEVMVGRYGFSTLKLKGGQGFKTDREMVRAVRGAVGDKVLLTVDANGAYSAGETPDYIDLLAEQGVAIAEDPCPLAADATLSELMETSPLPILVDMPCILASDAKALVAAGATALSVKPARIGLAEAEKIVVSARLNGASVCSGMYAESALGSLVSLQFSSAISSPLVAAEQTFFLTMTEQVIAGVLTVEEGRVTLPDDSDLDAMVDWRRLERVS